MADAALLMTGVGSEDDQRSVFDEFLLARGARTNPRQVMVELKGRLEEFRPLDDVRGRINVKNPLMRLLTLTMRDLATYFELAGSSTVERIDALAQAGVLDPRLAAGRRTRSPFSSRFASPCIPSIRSSTTPRSRRLSTVSIS